MSNADEIAHQQNLLAIHRRNLAHYLSQLATLGEAYAPPGLMNGIFEERANIKRIKDALRKWGVQVADQLNDEPPPAPAAERGQGSASSHAGRDMVSVQDSPGAITGQVGTAAQNFGTQNTTNAGPVIQIYGGDFRGSNLPIGNSVGGDLNQSGGAMSTFDRRGWNVQGNVYNIAGDLNMTANPSKDEFLAALRQLRDELAKAKDLLPDEASDLKTNLNDAIEAAERPQPNKDRAVKKLSAMKSILDGLKGNVGSALALGHLLGQVLAAAQNIRF